MRRENGEEGKDSDQGIPGFLGHEITVRLLSQLRRRVSSGGSGSTFSFRSWRYPGRLPKDSSMSLRGHPPCYAALHVGISTGYIQPSLYSGS